MITYYGGPLNCQHIDVDDPADTVHAEGGHYRLIDGNYHWHVSDPATDPETVHIRPKRTRTTTRSR